MEASEAGRLQPDDLEDPGQWSRAAGAARPRGSQRTVVELGRGPCRAGLPVLRACTWKVPAVDQPRNQLSVREITVTKLYYCYARGCCCGEPIVIRTINGRRVPIHI